MLSAIREDSAGIHDLLNINGIGTPDYVVGVNPAGGYWVKSGATGQVVYTHADAGVAINWAFTYGTFVGVQPTATPMITSTTIVIDGDDKSLSGIGGRAYIKQADGSNLDALIKVGNDSTNRVRNHVMHLTVDGNKANQTSGTGTGILLKNAGFVYLTDTLVSTCYGTGIVRDGSGTGFCFLTEVNVRSCGGSGFDASLNSPAGIFGLDVSLSWNTVDGLVLGTEEVSFTNLSLTNNTVNGGTFTNSSVCIANLLSQDNGGRGLNISGGSGSITGGTARRNGYQGVRMYSCAGWDVSGLTLYGNATLNTGSYDSNFYIGSSGNFIHDNYFIGNSGGGYCDYNLWLNNADVNNIHDNYFSLSIPSIIYGGTSNSRGIHDNTGHIAPGEIRSYSGTIATITENAFNSVDNPFGQAVRVLDLQIYVSTAATATSPNIDCGIGSSATTDYATMFDDLPGETIGFYKSTIATPGTQTVPILWASGSGNRYLNMSIKGAAATGMVASYTVTIMGN
jgi:hypothetical protein